MEYRILGPIEVLVDGVACHVGGPRELRVLAALLTSANRVVSAERLVYILWGERPPSTATAQIRNTLATLRRHLATAAGTAAPIVRSGAGFVARVEAGQLDAEMFEARVVRARAQAGEGQLAAATATLAAALSLWRGPALGGLGGPVVDAEARRLEEQRLACLERRIELDMELGRHPDIVGELAALVGEHPLRERLAELQVLCLYRCGRRQDALAAYAAARDRLSADTGLDPRPELLRLQQAILRGDADLDLPTAPTPDAGEQSGTRPAQRPTPAQLPARAPAFTGRAQCLACLDAMLLGSGGQPTITAITGTAGVGKTTLAVHWAHLVRPRFPDGQLYVNLRGFDPGGAAVDPATALRGFLDALGVTADRIPPEPADQGALYRSLVADRRVLVVLDNARDAEQVRPLLPGGSAAVVIVTSRDRLGGLAVRPGAHQIELGALPPDDAIAMIGRIIGADRTRAEPGAAADLARRCAYLPLALRIAAANLTNRRYRRVADLVADLTTDGWPDALDMDDDPDASVKVSFDHSYRGVTPTAQRLFRLLGLVPGPDFTEDTANALAAGPAGRDLRHLVTAHLVEQTASGRYTMHDLLRRYAIEAGRGADSPAERHAARSRLYHHYTRATDTAARAVYPQILRLPTDVVPAAGVDAGAALAWLDGERHNIVAAVHRAESDGFPEQTWILADTLRGYFSLRRFMPEWLAVATAALAAAERAGDVAGQVTARMSRAQVLWGLGRHGEAAASLVPAVHLARELDWPDGEAACLGNLGGIFGDWGRPTAALANLSAARQVFRRHGTPAMTEANQLTNLGAVCYDLGRLAEAAEHNHAALRLYTVIGAQVGVAQSRANLAQVLIAQGRLDRAARELAEALGGFRALGERHGEAAALIDLARLHAEIGDREAAARCADQAWRAAQEAKAPQWVSGALTVLGQVHRRPALHLRALREAAGTRYGELTALIGLAATLTATGAPGAAEQLGTRALAAARGTGYRLLEGHALVVLAEARADRREAVHLAGLAWDIYRECGSPRSAYRAGRMVLA